MIGAPRNLSIRVGALPLTTFLLIVTGLALRAGPFASQTHIVWLAGLCATGLPVVWRTIRGLLSGRFAADVVASLAIMTAILLDQPLPGLIVVLMQTGGEALEQYAEGRASAAVRELEAAAPRRANLIRDGQVEEVPATSVTIGDVLLIRPGDLVPCDGVITSGESELDTSSLTGEALPVRAIAGTEVMSGMANALGSFRMRVTAPSGRVETVRAVGFFFKPIATTDLVAYTSQNAAYLFDLGTRREQRIPGTVDPVPTPDGKFLTRPGLMFYPVLTLAAGDTVPVFIDRELDFF